MRSATIQLIRHATLRITYGDTVVLVDPMLQPIGALPPVPDTANTRRNPIARIPLAMEDVVDGTQLILATHTHRDHWDDPAAAALPRNVVVACQPEDEAKVRAGGFTRVSAVQQSASEEGIQIIRTGGRHGTGEIGAKMGPVSGYILKARDLPTIYIAGDTIWCTEMQDAMTRHKPDVIVVNAGAAQFNAGGPITMDAGDVIAVTRASYGSAVIAVHMETWNHCLLTRARLREELRKAGMEFRVSVPDDTEAIRI